MPKEKLKKGDDLKMTFAKRLAARKRNRRPQERGMDRHSYALLMMKSLKEKTPVDSENFTLLDADPANSASGVPYADWNAGDVQPFFYWNDPDRVNGNACFRSSVGGRCADLSRLGKLTAALP